MSKPSLTTYLLGNLLTLLASGIVMAWTIYEWLIGSGSMVTAGLCFIVAASSFQASNRITKYNLWQREWRGLGEPEPKRGIRLPSVIDLLGFGLLARLLRRRQPVKKDMAVRVCGNRVLLSPGVAQAYASLPNYCDDLLRPTVDR